MGKYTAQVKGGLHANYASSLGSIDRYNAAKDHREAAMALAGSKKGQLEFRALVDTLVGTVPGSNAIALYPEIEASVELGGKRNVNNTVIINRATTANDVADIKETLTSLSSDTWMPNPPMNGDRNPLGTR